MTKNKDRKYSEKQLAEGLVFPVKITAAEKREATAELAKARKVSLLKIAENDKLTLDFLRFKFQLEDYIRNQEFSASHTFGNLLKQYVDLLHLKRKDFAYAISIDEALLSQFINMHRLPPEYLFVRLELHSNNSIPASYWARLVDKQRGHELQTDQKIRRLEKKYVRDRIAI